jgi:hypothetical protein
VGQAARVHDRDRVALIDQEIAALRRIKGGLRATQGESRRR